MILNRRDVYKGALILVNSERPVRMVQMDALTAVNEQYCRILLHKTAVIALNNAFESIEAKDEIIPVSGYRSRKEQTAIFRQSLLENGEDFTRQYVALPDHSEHQTGLAVDLGRKAAHIDFIRPDFPDDGICKAFRQTAPDFGFVLRYEKQKESITGISYEPWHFRYVGCPHAKIMTENAMSLEEYTEFIKNYKAENPLRFGGYSVFFTPLEGESAVAEIKENCFTEISGNNDDGFIVTQRRTV